MAQLNEFEIDPSARNLTPDTVPLPNRPIDRRAANAIARITPKESRGFAKLAYAAWVVTRTGVSEETRFDNILDGTAGWTGGTYLTLTSGAVLGYIWFTHDGVGADPEPALHTEFGEVHVLSTDTGAKIAEKLYLALRNVQDTQPTYVYGTTQVTAKNLVPGVRTDATTGTLTGGVITVTIVTQGVDPDTTPWDGVYNDGAPQNLTYLDE